MKKALFERKKLASVGVAVFSFAMTVSAQAVIITDSFTVSGSAQAGMNTPETFNETDNNMPGANGSESANDMFGSQAGSDAFGNPDGRYAADATLLGDGAARATVEWTRTVTNDTSDPLDIFLDVFLYGGFLQAGQNQTAAYDWSITVSGDVASQVLLDSEVSVSGNSGPTTGGAASVLDPDGGGFGASVGGAGFYSWGSLTAAGIALGQLQGLNDSLVISYMLTTTVAGNNTGIDEQECFFAIDDEIVAVNTFLDEEGGQCFASAFSGDPNRVGGSNTITAIPVNPMNPIPEPGSLALLGLGLFGAAASRRKK